jgi:hypothetical protein
MVPAFKPALIVATTAVLDDEVQPLLVAST